MFHTKVSRFFITGLLATGLSYVSFPLFYEYVFDKSYNLSFFWSTFLNVTFSFTLQKYFVFKSKDHFFYEYIKFACSALLIIFVAYFSMQYLILNMMIKSFYANFLVVTISAIVSYLMHSLITFRRH